MGNHLTYAQSFLDRTQAPLPTAQLDLILIKPVGHVVLPVVDI
jgi:hypothetical protein